MTDREAVEEALREEFNYAGKDISVAEVDAEIIGWENIEEQRRPFSPLYSVPDGVYFDGHTVYEIITEKEE